MLPKTRPSILGGTVRCSSVVTATSTAAMPIPRTVCSAKATAIAQAKPVKRLPALLTAKPMISSGTIGIRTREADSTMNPARRPSPTAA